MPFMELAEKTWRPNMSRNSAPPPFVTLIWHRGSYMAAVQPFFVVKLEFVPCIGFAVSCEAYLCMCAKKYRIFHIFKFLGFFFY